MGSPEIGKRPTGMGEKPDDRWAVPLCSSCHRDGPGAQHLVGEKTFWRQVGVNPFVVAEALYVSFRATRIAVASDSAAEVRSGKRKRARPAKRDVDRPGKTKASRPRTKIPSRKDPWPPKGSRKIRRRP